MAKYPKYRDDDWDVPLKQYIDSFMGSAENVRLAREQIEATTRDLLAMYGATSGVENPTALAPFRAVDTTAETARVVLVGDSITDGGMSSTYQGTLSLRLQASLRLVLGRTGGWGYIPSTPSTQGAIVPSPPNTRVGTAVMWSHGLGGRAMYLGDANHHVTYDAQQFTQIKVYYGKTTIAGGGLKVEFGDVNGQNFVDQGAVLSSAAPAGEGNSSGHVWTSPVLGASHRTVRITSFAPPYVGILEGVEFINGDEASGLRVYNGAHSGGSVTAFNQASMDLHWEALTKINPHLTIVNLGTNDIAALTPAQFLSGMSTLIGKIPPLSRVLLVGNYLRGDYNTPAGRDKWQQMQEGLRGLATGRVAYINLAPHWPELVADGSTSEGLMFDTPPIHPNDAGMKKISDVLAAAIGPTSNLAFVGPRGPKGPIGDLSPASAAILNDAVADVVAAAADAEAARDEAVGLLVSSSSLTLSAADPVVPALSNVNEWTVSDALQVVLPPVNPGSQYTVHVKSGFQNLTWPNGTLVYGETDLQDVWVTLIRGDAGWNVLIPSPPLAGGSGAGLDTGWVNILAAYDLGSGATWVTGSAADVGTGWGTGVAPDFALNVKIRRTGNILHVAVAGLTKTAASGSSGADRLFTLPAGITLGSNNDANAVVPYHTASTAPAGVALLTARTTLDVFLRMLDGTTPPVGTILGRTSGSDVYGHSMLSFPIDPTSTWGT